MNSRLDDVRRRQAQLAARAAAQRDEVTAIFQRLQEPLRWTDTAVSSVRYLKAHPLIPAAVSVSLVAAFALSRHYSIFRLFQRAFVRGFALWRAYRSLGVWIAYARSALNMSKKRRAVKKYNPSGMQ